MILKLLHQIWLGRGPAPLVWTETWREANPDFTYRLWHEDATNAFMGAVPEHPVTLRYIDAVSGVRTWRPIWRLTGPGALTDVLSAQDDPGVTIPPAWTFFTHGLSGEAVPGGDRTRVATGPRRRSGRAAGR